MFVCIPARTDRDVEAAAPQFAPVELQYSRKITRLLQPARVAHGWHRKQLIDIGIGFENRAVCLLNHSRDVGLWISSLQLSEKWRREDEVAQGVEPENDEGVTGCRRAYGEHVVSIASTRSPGESGKVPSGAASSWRAPVRLKPCDLMAFHADKQKPS